MGEHNYENGRADFKCHIRAVVAALCLVLCGPIACSSGALVPVNSPDPQIEAKTPGILRKYDSFYIGDIQAYSIEGDYLRRIDDLDVRRLTEDFRRKLIASLGNRHSPVPQPTRNTAIINVALTDVSTNYAAFQIAPGMVFPNALRGGASMDAKVIDSVSREQLVRVRDSRSGARQGIFSGFGKWDGAQRAFDEWASMLAGAVSP